MLDGAYGIAGHDLPHHDETLFVGIDPHAEITRSFTFRQMFFPSLGDDYADIVRSGYDEMMRWDGRMLRKVGSRTANFTALKVLWVLKIFEIIVDVLEIIFIEFPVVIAEYFVKSTSNISTVECSEKTKLSLSKNTESIKCVYNKQI